MREVLGCWHSAAPCPEGNKQFLLTMYQKQAEAAQAVPLCCVFSWNMEEPSEAGQWDTSPVEKAQDPIPPLAWKGLASLSSVLSPDTSQISALFMGAAANSPASPRKILGNDVKLEMPGGTSVQPPQPWRIGPQQHPIYQILGKSNSTQFTSF